MSVDRDPVTVDGLRDGDTFTTSSGARFVVEAPFSDRQRITRQAPAPLTRDERRAAIVLAVSTVPVPAPWIVRALCETLARSEYVAGWEHCARFMAPPAPWAGDAS